MRIRQVHRNGNPAQYGESGFTLIEVIIVVVIVGLLMAVALPSYQGSLQKGRRSEAKSALMDVANRQEQFMLDRNRYTEDLTDLGLPDPYITEEGHYAVQAVGCGAGIATCYRLTATPRVSSPQVKDARCTSFSLDSSGTKSATGTTQNECW
ncbi:type IV pilin protein [Parahaliea mediterranea]|uniref:Prepilin-type N-terminal cleavage/methylation domain-containing protein n=1 Tax=Parahaliea mediterranea TaxID=651086 RepID=A0A939DCT6_9GAMM|nr:prepilin-type N-terminal cleavage/methylation domain-containing protein [Parahaliea mediterranea]